MILPGYRYLVKRAILAISIEQFDLRNNIYAFEKHLAYTSANSGNAL